MPRTLVTFRTVLLFGDKAVSQSALSGAGNPPGLTPRGTRPLDTTT